MTDLIRKSDALAVVLLGGSPVGMSNRIAALEPVAALDPAAIREAAIRECAEKVRAVVDAWAKAPVEDFHPEDPDRPDLMGEAVKLLHSIAPSILALIQKGTTE